MFTESHMDLPGAPDIVKQLDAYLDAKGVRHLFVELGEMLLQRTPANPVIAVFVGALLEWHAEARPGPGGVAASRSLG